MKIKQFSDLDTQEVLAKVNPVAAMWRTEDAHTPREFHMIEGREVQITIGPAPPQTAAGKWVAKLYVRDGGSRHKGWPRYYFDLIVAQKETETWLKYNGELILATRGQNEDTH